VSPRVLISESDWRLLEFAFGDLRRHGYEVMVESSPLRALDVVKQWRPEVVIASSHCLGEWENHVDGWLETMPPHTTIMVTANTDDSDSTWQEWADRGCEVLFKPLVHSSELRVATEQALSARAAQGQARPTERGGPRADGSAKA